MKTLKREMSDLRKRNEELEAQLAGAREELENASQPKRGAKARVGARELQKTVSELKGQMKELQKVSRGRGAPKCAVNRVYRRMRKTNGRLSRCVLRYDIIRTYILAIGPNR